MNNWFKLTFRPVFWASTSFSLSRESGLLTVGRPTTNQWQSESVQKVLSFSWLSGAVVPISTGRCWSANDKNEEKPRVLSVERYFQSPALPSTYRLFGNLYTASIYLRNVFAQRSNRENSNIWKNVWPVFESAWSVQLPTIRNCLGLDILVPRERVIGNFLAVLWDDDYHPCTSRL